MKKLPVAFICDKRYAIATAVAVTSMVCNKNPDTYYDVYIITADLPDYEIMKLRELRGRNIDVRVIEASMERYKGICNAGHISVAACLKFDLPSLIPERDMVLYLDSDIMVQKDLSGLFDVDIEGVYAAATKDYLLADNELNIKNYFNSGVMLLNLKLMRESGTPDALLNLRKNEHDLKYMDQDCFNVHFQDKVRFLPVLYNIFYNSEFYARKKHELRRINDCFGTDYLSWDDIKKDSYIIHLVGYDKPWLYFDSAAHPEWHGYFKKSPFKFHKLNYGSVKLMRFVLSHHYTHLSYFFFKYWRDYGFVFAMGKVKKKLSGNIRPSDCQK